MAPITYPVLCRSRVSSKVGNGRLPIYCVSGKKTVDHEQLHSQGRVETCQPELSTTEIIHNRIKVIEQQVYSKPVSRLRLSRLPETGCVSLLKAMAMGSIPITSRFANSTLPELTSEWDMGPRHALASHLRGVRKLADGDHIETEVGKTTHCYMCSRSHDLR